MSYMSDSDFVAWIHSNFLVKKECGVEVIYNPDSYVDRFYSVDWIVEKFEDDFESEGSCELVYKFENDRFSDFRDLFLPESVVVED